MSGPATAPPLKNNQPKSRVGGKRPGAGRKKGVPNKVTADVRALAGEYAPEAIKELGRLSLEAESEAARVSAIKELLDRAYGKSTQPLAGDGDGNPIRVAHTIHIVGVEP